jgi:hypothetical protein
VLDIVGQLVSWAGLLGVPAAALIALSAALAGLRHINPMWDTLLAILAVVFLHGALCVWTDLRRLRRERFFSRVRAGG